jgi:hypothetical protein
VAVFSLRLTAVAVAVLSPVVVAVFSPRLTEFAFPVSTEEAVTLLLSLLTGRNGSATIRAVLATPATNAAPISTSRPVRRRPRE